MLERRDGQALTQLEDYRRLAAFERQALDEPAVSGVLSILTLLRPLHRAESGGTTMSLPDSQDELTVLLELLALAPDRHLPEMFLTPGREVARLRLQLPVIGSQQAAALAERLKIAGEESYNFV